MQKWNELNSRLSSLSGRYEALLKLFETFAGHVESQVTDRNFHIKGITVPSASKVSDAFVVIFAGRTFKFAFSVELTESGTFKGVVTCNLVRTWPEVEYKKVGAFTFSGTGETNQQDPEGGESISLNNDLGALYLALDLVHTGLSA